MAGDGLGELNKLAADLEKAGLFAASKGAKLVRATAHAIEGTAKQFAPVDTGALRNSIGVDITASGLAAEIGPTVLYGGMVEWGTSKMPPHAYVGPALDRHSPDFVQGVEELGGHTLD